MDSGRCRERSICAVLVAGLVVWFLLICILANQASEKTSPRRISSTTRTINIFTLIANRRRHYNPPGGHPNFHAVSKRRVPNGPDPIHNRGEGNY